MAAPSDFPAPIPAPPRLRHAVIGFVAALAIASIIGVALSPYLLVEHPVLLLALSPLGRHLALAVADSDPTVLVIVTVVRRVVGELASYGLGLVYGNAAVLWMEARTPKLGRFVRWVETQFIRFGSPLLIVAPAHSLCLLAGAARVRFWVVALFLTLGEILWVIGTTYFGAAIATWSRVILDFFATHKLESTLVCVVLVAGRLLWSWRKRRLSSAQDAEPAIRHSAD